MITEKDLQEAIAECEGERSPNAHTCMKLAAFYTIREHMFPQNAVPVTDAPAYSYASQAVYQSDTEFWQAAKDLSADELASIADELMSTLQIVQPRLYAGVIRKIKSLVP